MRIDELDADEFMQFAAVAAASVCSIAESDSGKAFGKAFSEFQGSLKDVPEEERDGKAGKWLVKTVLTSLPAFCKENGDAVYDLLAAADGQTTAEYKKGFKPVKLLADVKALVEWAVQNLESVTAFLA